MKRALFFALLCCSVSDAQTCPLPAPAAPPKANQVIVTLPADGGTSGCTFHATSTTGVMPPQEYGLSVGKCGAARQFGDQAVANDNGWNDGGVP